jgi:stage III sporulation protein SpoIIIAA
MYEQNVSTTDISRLLAVLPPQVQIELGPATPRRICLRLVLDLGRMATARTTAGERELGTAEVTREDLAYVIANLGDFGDDNRAGLTRTLHRISAIRNRKGEVIGLTCRVGRAVRGTLEIVRDLVTAGKSVLLLGRPGIGKTTLLREAARVLADEARKRVVIVDTSNEIAGDGDIPHPGKRYRPRWSTYPPSVTSCCWYHSRAWVT